MGMIRNYIRIYGFNKDTFMAIEQGMRTTVDMNAPPGPGDEILTLYGKWAENREYNKITKNYPFFVELSDLNDDKESIVQWCMDNIKSPWYFHYQRWLKMKPTLRFEKEEDLMAVKLRWM